VDGIDAVLMIDGNERLYFPYLTLLSEFVIISMQWMSGHHTIVYIQGVVGMAWHGMEGMKGG